MDQEKLLITAKKAALAAGEILACYYRRDYVVEIKNQLSPLVTKADREAELAMRQIIRAAFPEHCIIGEEFGTDIPVKNEIGEGRIIWVLDPLDGTSAFVAGLPTFVILIGVWQGEQPLLGIIFQPITGDMWLAAGDDRTLLNGNPCRSLLQLDDPLILATTSIDLLHGQTRRAFKALQEKAVATVFGGDGHLYASIASGRIGIVIEERLRWHDVAAIVPIVNGAGGVTTDLCGAAIKPGCERYSIIACASKKHHEMALEILSDVK